MRFVNIASPSPHSVCISRAQRMLSRAQRMLSRVNFTCSVLYLLLLHIALLSGGVKWKSNSNSTDTRPNHISTLFLSNSFLVINIWCRFQCRLISAERECCEFNTDIKVPCSMAAFTTFSSPQVVSMLMLQI